MYDTNIVNENNKQIISRIKEEIAQIINNKKKK